MTKLEDSIQYLKGVGPKKLKKFKSLEIETIKDLLEYYPRSYDDQSNFKMLYNTQNNEKATFDVLILGLIEVKRIRKNLNVTNFLIEDVSGKAVMSFFNMPYINLQKDKIKY